MLLSQGQYGQLLDRSRSHTSTSIQNTTPFPTDPASLTVANTATEQSHDQNVPVHDPFTYYKAFLGSGALSDSQPNDYIFRDDGYTKTPSGKSACSSGVPLQGRTRAISDGANVRFACRSNGAPLATIVEQRSVSTLNSRGSRLSVGRHPSVRSAVNTSTARNSATSSTGLDSEALRSISEEGSRKHDLSVSAIIAREEPRQDYHESRPVLRWRTPACTPTHELDTIDAYLTDDGEHSQSVKGFKAFLRNALHNVRGGRPLRSDECSVTNPISSQIRGESLFSTEISLTKGSRDGDSEKVQPDGQRPSASPPAPKSHLDVPGPPDSMIEGQARSRKILDTSHESSAEASPYGLHPSRLICDSHIESAVTCHQPLDPGLLHSSEGTERASSVRPVLPEPRDVQRDHVQASATGPSHLARNNHSAGHAMVSEPTDHDDAPSLREHDRTRDTTRNTSVCSTMSTSYSGTVLGIDLDLHHEFPHPSKRSVTPVWFSPCGLPDIALSPQVYADTAQQSLPRSMTSSALPALLPIAAAEGIVEPNLTAPQISFFSPSGNLIQAESSSPLPSDAHDSESPNSSEFTVTPISFNGAAQPTTAYDALSAVVGLPPARPALVPMTTPPHSFAPLPEHLRYHHNYRRPDRSYIASEAATPTICSDAGPRVTGCDGVFEHDTLMPHDDTDPAHVRTGRKSLHGRSISCLSPREFARSRARSPKGGKLRKRAPSHSASTFGQTASHTMRVCFCQPYDGAGRPSTPRGCHTSDQQRDSTLARQARETETPNVRIVDGKGLDEES